MLKSEFCLLINVNPETFPEADFEKINSVYMEHPSIRDVDGKKQISGIYLLGGMQLIDDMYERILVYRRLNSKIVELECEIKDICAERDAEIEKVIKKYSGEIDSRYKTVAQLKDELSRFKNK